MKNFKTTKRFDNAVRKLYTAFHERKLSAYECSACAVGNILGHGDWSGGYAHEDDLIEIYFDGWIRTPPDNWNKSGYSPMELAKIEEAFMSVFEKELHGKMSHEGKISAGKYNTELQFKGLCAVVEYLCELDNIPNVLDYTKLFETKEGKPKYQLV